MERKDWPGCRCLLNWVRTLGKGAHLELKSFGWALIGLMEFHMWIINFSSCECSATALSCWPLRYLGTRQVRASWEARHLPYGPQQHCVCSLWGDMHSVFYSIVLRWSHSIVPTETTHFQEWIRTPKLLFKLSELNQYFFLCLSLT